MFAPQKRVFTSRNLLKQEPLCPYATSRSGNSPFNRPQLSVKTPTYTPRQRLDATRHGQSPRG